MDENTYFNLHKLKFSILLNLFKKKFIYIYIFIYAKMGICPFRPKDMKNAHFNVKLDLMKSKLFGKIHMELKSHKKKFLLLFIFKFDCL